MRPEEVEWTLPYDLRYCVIMTSDMDLQGNLSAKILTYSVACSEMIEKGKYILSWTFIFVVYSCWVQANSDNSDQNHRFNIQCPDMAPSVVCLTGAFMYVQ